MSNNFYVDLMMPRYKVVSDWPGRKDFMVGEVVTLNKEFSPAYKKYEVEDCQGIRTYITSFFEMFPLQFRRLEWWQERKIYSEMPTYIKWRDSFFKVANWGTSPNSSEITKAYIVDGFALFISDCQPATEEQYLAYQPNKNI